MMPSPSSAWAVEELARHGHRLSPGTLYPIVPLEKKGLLFEAQQVNGKIRRVYSATRAGKSLEAAKSARIVWRTVRG
jgi:DNA-binding PadR family transcriptional regulator